MVIELEMDVRRPRIELELWAEKDSLPLVRQSLRALGESAGIEADAVHSAELAVTEACANAVRHAYRGRGRVEVSLEVRPDDLLAIVRDRGRGMSVPWRGARREGDGLGLTVIAGIADQLEVRSSRRQGTEVVMALPFASQAAALEAGLAPKAGSLAHVVRRLVAMVAAQADMTPDRITEALLVAELVVSNACEELLGDRLTVALSRLPDGLELRIGPLEPGGAEAALRKAEVPVLGSIVERLADRLWTEQTGPGGTEPGERLAARFGQAPMSA